MKTEHLSADHLVVGGGPAGIAAVCVLAEAGHGVLWIDQAARPGGQIWRAGVPPTWAKRLEAALARPGVRLLAGHAVIAADHPRSLLLHDLLAPQRPAIEASAPRLLLATGAREKLLPFPGWDLPGVHGAGGLQALVKNGWPIRDKRVVLAGSGPLLLATADTLRAAGAKLALIAEQAPQRALLAFAARLPAAKIAQAAGLRWRLRGVPYRAGVWATRALGTDHVGAVELTDGRRTWPERCEALGVGFGLWPNTELAELLGAALHAGPGGAIAVDAQQRTSLPAVWAAGECAGIGGADKALVEGEIAALAMLERATAAMQHRRAAAHAFATRLADSFALRPELLRLPEAATLVCRCEDVSLGLLRAQPGWRDAKLQTRCGMGACQGRICGPITEQLLGWPRRGVRAPLQPVPVHCFVSDDTA